MSWKLKVKLTWNEGALALAVRLRGTGEKAQPGPLRRLLQVEGVASRALVRRTKEENGTSFRRSPCS